MREMPKKCARWKCSLICNEVWLYKYGGGGAWDDTELRRAKAVDGQREKTNRESGNNWRTSELSGGVWSTTLTTHEPAKNTVTRLVL